MSTTHQWLVLGKMYDGFKFGEPNTPVSDPLAREAAHHLVNRGEASYVGSSATTELWQITEAGIKRYGTSLKRAQTRWKKRQQRNREPRGQTGSIVQGSTSVGCKS
jgi:hypothetical protein